jgi:hypothetical protein
MSDYLSNHVRVVGYRLEIGPDPLINIKGYSRLRTPEHILIEPIIFFIIHA